MNDVPPPLSAEAAQLETELEALSLDWASPDPVARERLLRNRISRVRDQAVARVLQVSFEAIEWELPTDDARFLPYFGRLARFELERSTRDREWAAYEAESAAARGQG